MISFMLTIGFLFGLIFVSFPCEGQINLPPSGDRLVVAPGDDATIAWSFNNTLAQVISRTWTFTSSSQGSTSEQIAVIVLSGNRVILDSSLPQVEIKKEATLVLRNVSSRYDGTYTFTISGGGSSDTSNVRLFVAIKPNVKINCSSFTTVDEGSDVICLCDAYGENPPGEVNVTWYKDGVKQGVTRDEENILSLSNVDGNNNGSYKCLAQGYFNLTGEKSVEVKVRPNFAPVVKSVSSSPTKAVLGKSVTISCEASARPSPTYTMYHNCSKVSDENTYKIDVVRYNDAGFYRCVTNNKLGNSSETFILVVTGPVQPTPLAVPTASSSSKVAVATKNASNKMESESIVLWHVVVALLSGIIIGVLLSQVFGYSRRRFRNRKPAQSNPEPQTSSKVDSIYQDLDLSKMNQEENYQTLGAMNSGDGESDYTGLNLARDEEENYQTRTKT